MDNNIIEEIKNKVDIVSVIGEYVTLQKRGKNYFGLCPFHDDRNPSMSVSSDKQIYKCFSCGASGNVFNFVMDYEHLSFKETLKKLGDKYGINTNSINVSKEVNKHQEEYEIYDLATKIYQNNLFSTVGKKAREYLEKRKITTEEIKRFGIGLSTSSSSLVDALTSKNYNSFLLEKLGLVNNNKDVYINRIMFPLEDLEGNVVAFSGRIYNNEKEVAKYINTMETDIFKKGELLYNYKKAQNIVRQKKEIIIVEGFMDVIRLSTIGIFNVVALMGTAFTKNQLKEIKKLTNNVILLLDGDEAGIKATISIGKELEDNDFNVKVIPLKNDDPDEYIIKEPDSFLTLYKNPVSFSEFYFGTLKKNVNFDSDKELANYVDKVLKEIGTISDEIRREILLKKLEKETEIDYNTLEIRLATYLKPKKEVEKKIIKTSLTKEKLNKYTKAMYGFVLGMLEDNEVVDIYLKENIIIPDKLIKALCEEISYVYQKRKMVNERDIYTCLIDKEELLTLFKKIISKSENIEVTKELINDYLKVIKEASKKEEIKRLTNELSKEINVVEKAKIAERIRLIKLGSNE